MVSAVLASGRKSSWGQSVGGRFMGKKLPHTNQPNPNPNPNPNPSPTPKSKKFRSLGERSASLAEALDDEHSFSQTPLEQSRSFSDKFSHDQYNTFDIGSSTRNELIELKKRLVDELEEVRRFKDDIEKGKFHPKLLSEKRKRVSGNKRQVEKLIERPLERDLKGLLSESAVVDPGDVFVGGGGGGEIGELMKMCKGVLAKLMKLKSSWIFKDPVDAVALGLHDYHDIVKKPMDLGTVRSNFAKNVYSSPEEFAADVRLTFENAMLYNPKGDEVHKMAEELIDRFDIVYRPIREKFESMIKRPDGGLSDGHDGGLGDGLQEEGNSWNQVLKPERKKKPKLESIQNLEKKDDSPVLKSTIPEPRAKPGGGNRGKLPKPKAKDPNKREMSMDEKEKLGDGLQNLPQEKMPQLVQIIRKRNAYMAPEGDEIELDIEAIDTETLWELDRFVTNWKKMDSKNKRQALMANASAAASGEDNVPVLSEKADAVEKGVVGEEEVGIEDEMPMASVPPVEIEKDNGVHDDKDHPARSSSSSGSESSSDSDSGSSSGSDSDADDAQSRGLESKNFSETCGELESKEFSETGGA